MLPTVDRFARVMRERLTTGEVPFRKAYIGSIVDRIEVDDAQVRIMGRKEILEQAVRSSGTMPPVVHTVDLRSTSSAGARTGLHRARRRHS